MATSQLGQAFPWLATTAAAAAGGERGRSLEAEKRDERDRARENNEEGFADREEGLGDGGRRRPDGGGCGGGETKEAEDAVRPPDDDDDDDDAKGSAKPTSEELLATKRERSRLAMQRFRERKRERLEAGIPEPIRREKGPCHPRKRIVDPSSERTHLSGGGVPKPIRAAVRDAPELVLIALLTCDPAALVVRAEAFSGAGGDASVVKRISKFAADLNETVKALRVLEETGGDEGRALATRSTESTRAAADESEGEGDEDSDEDCSEGDVVIRMGKAPAKKPNNSEKDGSDDARAEEGPAGSNSGGGAPTKKRKKQRKKCRHPSGCHKSAIGRCDGMCQSHFRSTNPDAPPPRAGKPEQKRRMCRHEDRRGRQSCDKQAANKCDGMCIRHYREANPGAPPPREQKKESRTCSAEGCDKWAAHRSGGMCRAHFRSANPDAPLSDGRRRCGHFDGCDKLAASGCDGMCQAHFRAANPYAPPPRGKRRCRYPGGCDKWEVPRSDGMCRAHYKQTRV